MTSFAFPGQGSQFFGMCRDFYENFDISKNVIQEIEDITLMPIKKIIFDEDSGKLNLTNYTQICIFAASMSIFKVIEKKINLKKFNINTMLGHSLGEYTALCASSKIDLSSASKLLKLRGELMNNAIESNLSGMAALIGLGSKDVEKIINDNKLEIFIANDNTPQQVVISGMIENIKHSENIFIKNGAKKFVLLNVSAAFHSPIMLNAQKKLQISIENINFNESKISILSNFSAKISNNIIAISG